MELSCKDSSGNEVPFHPTGLKFIDGSVKADLPVKTISELFNVQAFIVSQTNPWVVPLLSDQRVESSYVRKVVRILKRCLLMEF